MPEEQEGPTAPVAEAPKDKGTAVKGSLWSKLTGKPESSDNPSLWSKLGEQSQGKKAATAPAKEPPKDIVAELMPRVQELLSKEGPVDEAAMLKLISELEKSGELSGNVHTIGEGQDRAIILRRAVKRATESTSYGPAIRPNELIPIGTMTTSQSEWLAMNRKGFIKYIVVDGQKLQIDETSAYFDDRRYPDSHWNVANYTYEGPAKPQKFWIDKTRTWADEVEGYVQYTFGEKNGKIMAQLLSHDNYPPEPSESPFSSYEGRPPQPEVDKFYDEKDLNSFGHHFHPESGWSHLDPTEGQRKASRALRRGDNPVGWELNQWHNSFYRVDSPEFVQEALRANSIKSPEPAPTAEVKREGLPVVPEIKNNYGTRSRFQVVTDGMVDDKWQYGIRDTHSVDAHYPEGWLIRVGDDGKEHSEGHVLHFSSADAAIDFVLAKNREDTDKGWTDTGRTFHESTAVHYDPRVKTPEEEKS